MSDSGERLLESRAPAPTSNSAPAAPAGAAPAGAAPADAAPADAAPADAASAGARGAAAKPPGTAGLQAQDAGKPGRFGIDGVSGFFGMRWQDPQTVGLTIRPELINAGGLLSGVATYALVDYCMGSALWAQTSREERIATISISVNYIQTAIEGDIVCHTVLDRRNRSNAVMRSEVRHEDGRLLVTAIGSYTIFVPRRGTASR